jgi:hypothetical protein
VPKSAAARADDAATISSLHWHVPGPVRHHNDISQTRVGGPRPRDSPRQPGSSWCAAPICHSRIVRIQCRPITGYAAYLPCVPGSDESRHRRKMKRSRQNFTHMPMTACPPIAS